MTPGPVSRLCRADVRYLEFAYEISDIYIIIGIYVRFVYPFPPYTPEAPNIIVYLGYPGILMFAGVRVFKVFFYFLFFSFIFIFYFYRQGKARKDK